MSQLERIKSEQPLDFGFLARHSFSPRPEALDARQARLIIDSYGKGSTAEQGEASALMKALERYCGIFQGDEIRTTRRFVDFPPGDAILPNDILQFSDAQYEHGLAGDAHSGARGPIRFDPSAEMEWSPAWSLRDERFKHIPTDLLYFFHDASGNNQVSSESNGCAAGNTVEEAILQGFLELVERDACAIWWYNRLQRAEIDLNQLGDSYILDLRSQLGASGRRLWVLDVTSDLGIPVVIAVAHWKEDSRDCVELAGGADFDLRIATLRAMTELNQFLAVDRMSRRAAPPTAEYKGGALQVPLRKNVYLVPHGKARRRGVQSAKFQASIGANRSWLA